MAARQYRVDLSDQANLSVEFTTIGGEVVSFVVRLMLNPGHGDACVVRFDTAHGRPHMDRVDRKGRLQEKEWLLGMGFSEALCYAIQDLKANYETYILQFEKASRGKS
jgi:hypothetical protein